MKIRDKDQLWKTTLAQIEIKLDAPAKFKTFFQDTILLELDGKHAVIGVPNAYTSEWLNVKHMDLVKDTISYVYGDKLIPIFEVYQDKDHKKDEAPVYTEEDSPLLASENGLMNSVLEEIEASGLNPKYSMSNYIVGDANRMAHAAALAIIDKPGGIYNPFFIYGKTGVGKTHLAQAIGRAVLERNLRKKIVYISSENFLNEMVRGIKTGTMDKFRAKYRPVDILMIDDMQLISTWVKTQDEFFNTFNELYNSGKQIIMIADRKPEDIKNLESRLRSRMNGGMVVDIAQPEYEMRLAIAQKKSETMGVAISKNSIDYIARNVTDNVRAIEGAIQKVSLYNRMKPTGELTLEEIAHTLGVDSEARREKVKIPTVVRTVAKSFGVAVKDIKGSGRTKDVALARQVVMFILREEFNYKLEQIAGFVNRKDHTTVIHAIDKVRSKMMIQEGFNKQISEIIAKIQEESAVEEE